MSVENFISKRYLFAKHRLNFITIISYLSIGGITIGVAALIVVLSVFNGFGDLVSLLLINFDAHVKIEFTTPEGEKKKPELEKFLNEQKNISGRTEFVSGKIVVRGSESRVVELKGITASGVSNVYGINENMRFGSSELLTNYPHKFIIGLQLADRLQVVVDDSLYVISPASIQKSIINLSFPAAQKGIIGGIYHSNNNEYDGGYIFTDLISAQRILGRNNLVQGYELKLTDINDAGALKNEITKKFGEGISVSTWYDLHEELFSVMLIERWTAYLILSLIIAVAAFNILASLSMTVMEKRRDIGVLTTLGLPQYSIAKIFLRQGIIIGLIGTLGGFALGVLVYFLQTNYNLYPLDPALYKIDSLPMNLRFSDFTAVGLASFVLSFLASLIPAKRAQKIDPLDSIRWE